MSEKRETGAFEAWIGSAVALRMAYLRAAPDRPPPIVSRDEEGAVAGDAIRLPGDAPPEALAASVPAAGGLPAVVAVEGQGVFTVAAPVESGRMAGLAVLVTGAAQGFGLGMARGLLAHGAYVAIADVNEDLGREVAEELSDTHGRGRAVFCAADVADGISMAGCVARTVRAFGGLDMLISNAGVLRAGGLEELTEADFDLVTRVNYRGYFVSARAALPVMRLQHRLFPARWMDIIQVNSKSGLAGSNRNFAYAGSKFGGLGLTQSLALELVEWGIKVNAVCPGNYYEGPLWSDPRRGLFRQYLDAGKVPGAGTIEDVKRFYMDKVPMRRGCTPEDVVRAVLYLHEQQYETGQALPVTGGQVMLK